MMSPKEYFIAVQLLVIRDLDNDDHDLINELFIRGYSVVVCSAIINKGE